MTVSSHFSSASGASPARPKKPPPVSVRLTWDEYERLRDLAGAMSMAAFIRMRTLGEEERTPARKAYTRKQTSPAPDLVMIGKMLGGLGQSELASSLSEMAEASRVGALPVTPETDAEIRDACRAVKDMRDTLVSAMGVKVR